MKYLSHAFDANIVTVFFEYEGQRLLVAPFDPQEHFPGPRHIKRCIEVLPLGGAAVSPLEMRCLAKDRSKGNEVERHKGLLKQEHSCVKGIIAIAYNKLL
jgi:hypothetical protein